MSSLRGSEVLTPSAILARLRTVAPSIFLGEATVPKAAGFTAAAADRGRWFRCSGTFTIAFDAVATLANGWSAFFENVTGSQLLDPAGAETIAGAATLTLADPGTVVLVICTGTALLAVTIPKDVFRTTQTIDLASGTDSTSNLGVTNNLLLRGSDSLPARIGGRAWAGLSAFSVIAQCMGGTRAAPTATPDSVIMFQLSAFGYDGSVYSAGANAQYRTLSDGLWTLTNRGVMHQWFGTPNASVTQAEWMRAVDGCLLLGTTVRMTGVTGGLSVGGTTDATSPITGVVQIAGGLGIAKNLVTGQGLGLGVTKTATAAGTTTLTAASKAVQVFTGVTTQTCVLPAANAFGAGVAVVVIIKNRSSGVVTAQRAGADTIEGANTLAIAGGAVERFVSDGISEWERC